MPDPRQAVSRVGWRGVGRHLHGLASSLSLLVCHPGGGGGRREGGRRVRGREGKREGGGGGE